jgi:hypothetical protein
MPADVHPENALRGRWRVLESGGSGRFFPSLTSFRILNYNPEHVRVGKYILIQGI